MSDVKVLGKAMDSDSNVRLEALKLAYEVAFKTDELTKYQGPAQRYGTLQEVMDLAEINYQFIKNEPIKWE